MKRKEWNNLIFADALKDYKHYQPDWNIKVIDNEIKIFNKKGLLVGLFVAYNNLYITFFNQNGEAQTMTINRGKLYTGMGRIYDCDIYTFCERIKYYGFKYQKLNNFFEKAIDK